MHPAHRDRRDDRPHDHRRDRDAGRRPRLLRPHGADRPVRGDHPGRNRDAVAALAPRRRRALDPLPARLHDRPARVPRDRGAARGHRDRRQGAAAFGGAALVWLGAAAAFLALAGVDAWLRGDARRGARAPACRTSAAGTARAASDLDRQRPTDGAGGAGLGYRAALPRRDRHRAPQPRRGTRDRVRLRGRLARARRHAGGRLRAPQHHRGARDRRAGRARARRAARPPGAARPDRRRARRARRVDRRVRLPARPGRADVRRRRRAPSRRWSSRSRRRSATRAGRLLHPLAVGGLLTGLAVMYATGLLVSL